MGPSLLELPDECICLILSLLRPSQVRRIALAFNRRLFAICKPFLEPLIKIRKDELYFESLFGGTNPGSLGDIGEAELKDVEFTNVLTSTPANPFHHFEYLDLKDDLAWFEDIAKEEDADLVEGVVNNDYDCEDLDVLIETTGRLGLTLPSSFIKLLKSEHLLEKLPTCRAWYIELFPLVKTRKQHVNDPTKYDEGYIFTWFSDQQSTYYASLYLDTAGRHALLGSDGPAYSREENEGWKEDWLDLTDVEKREGIVAIASDSVAEFELLGASFEHWLVHHYYSQRLGSLDHKNEKGESLLLPKHIKRHFYNVYTEEGRELQ